MFLFDLSALTRQTDRQTDRHLYLVIKLRVVPSGAKSNLLSTGDLNTKIHYLQWKILYKRYNNVNIIKLITI